MASRTGNVISVPEPIRALIVPAPNPAATTAMIFEGGQARSWRIERRSDERTLTGSERTLESSNLAWPSMHDEHVINIDCFGARCTIALTNGGGAPLRAIAAASFLLECHRRLSRFLPDSELSRLNADPRETVPVSPLMLDFLGAVRRAGESSGGLVDPTILPALRDAGYATSARRPRSRPARGPAAARRAARPRPIPPRVGGRSTSTQSAANVTRPPGLEIDSGGVAKGWAADRAAAILGRAPTLAVECAGDIRVSGSAGVERRIAVTDPFDGATIGVLAIADGGVATSGIGKRRWRNADGRPSAII